jgi:hypothetical protein
MPRILTKLRVREVSAVDRGAGEGVKVMLMKRDEPLSSGHLYDFAKADSDVMKAGSFPNDPGVAGKVHQALVLRDADAYLKRTFTAEERRAATASGAAMAGGGYPIENKSDLHNAIHAIGRGKAPHASIREHITSRARALGLTADLPTDWKVNKMTKSFTEVVKGLLGFGGSTVADHIATADDALARSIASILGDATLDATAKSAAVVKSLEQHSEHLNGTIPAAIEKALSAAGISAADLMKGADMTDEEKKKLEEAEETKKNLAKAQREIRVLKMSDKHSSYCAARGDDMSATEKEKFQDMEPGERDAHMAAHPVKEDTAKAFEAAVEKRVETSPTVVALRKQVEMLTAGGELATFTKRAIDMGIGEANGVTLQKAFAGDKEAIEKLAKMVEAANNQAREAGIFKEIGGVGAVGGSTAFDQITAKAAELRKADPKLTEAQAFSKAYSDPANAEIAKRDVAERRERIRA